MRDPGRQSASKEPVSRQPEGGHRAKSQAGGHSPFWVVLGGTEEELWRGQSKGIAKAPGAKDRLPKSGDKAMEKVEILLI